MNRLLESGDPSLHFIEGLILTPQKYVLMTGTMTDGGHDKRPNEVTNRIGQWHKPWFYKHGNIVLISHSVARNQSFLCLLYFSGEGLLR